MLHEHPVGPPGFWTLTTMWFGMMAAMMAPTVWPWVRSFYRFTGSDPVTRLAGTSQFASGYLVAWLAYSVAAALIQRLLQAAGSVDPATGIVSWMGGGVFVIAGLYQFAPLKRACLSHCRNPFTYFLTQWRNGPIGGFRMGATHGLYCVGCCWALMATTLAVGVMNIWWMVVLAVLALVEQVAPYGHTIRRPLGLALLAASIWRFSV